MTIPKIKNNKSKNIFTLILLSLLLIVLIVAISIYIPCLSNSQYIILRIALAIAIAGYASWIPGYIHVNLRPSIHATGTIAVFLVVYFFTPKAIQNDKCRSAFSVTIFLRDSTGKVPIKNQGSLSLKLNDNLNNQLINNEGSCTFKQIPYSFFNTNTSILIEGTNWEFQDGKKSTDLALDSESKTLIIKRDNSWCCVRGTVRNYDNFLSGVRVRIGTIFSLTDSNGRFELIIPTDQQREEYKLIIQEKGYKMYEKLVYPIGDGPDILLEKTHYKLSI